MKLSESLEAALNKQIGCEFAACLSYLSMASYFDRMAYDGFASWMHLQSDEERLHAMKFYNYLLDRDGVVQLPAIQAPRFEFDSPLQVFKSSLSQEQAVSKSIYEIYKLAHDEGDYATVSFLKWFIDEQVEEEKNVSDMIDKLERAADNPEAILLLDRYASEREPESED